MSEDERAGGQHERGEEPDERPIWTALAIGAVIVCAGIAWTAVAPSSFSGAAILIGFATAAWGTHRYGRLGAG